MGRIWHWREEEAGEFWEAARALLRGGGLMAVPTETFYALAAHPLDEVALARLFAVKGRAPEKPVLLLVSDCKMLPQVAREVPEVASRLLARFWPGPLTLILPARPDLPRLLTGGSGTVGVRQPRQEVTCRLMAALGFPITGTSANRADRPPLTLAAEVDREFGPELGLILDAGPCPGGLPSTVVDVTRTPPRLVRPGAVPVAALAAIIPELAESVDPRPSWRENPRR
jgi:L-threonylcarbamoyladenylate synthase